MKCLSNSYKTVGFIIPSPWLNLQLINGSLCYLSVDIINFLLGQCFLHMSVYYPVTMTCLLMFWVQKSIDQSHLLDNVTAYTANKVVEVILRVIFGDPERQITCTLWIYADRLKKCSHAVFEVLNTSVFLISHTPS